MNETQTAEVTDGLRRWARGSYTLSAAAELLIHWGPPLLSGPWVEFDPDQDRYWFNVKTADGEGFYLSGGERRGLKIAAALADDEHPVALGDAVSGLDRKHLALVLAALAHAAGSHEHSRTVTDGTIENEDLRILGFEKLGSLYPWPEDA